MRKRDGVNMKKYLSISVALFTIVASSFVNAAEKSSDKMILEWKPEKIWINKNELCMLGEFTNKRNDLTITRLDDFSTEITFTGSDGSSFNFVGKPKKMPFLKIEGTGSKKVTFNFGTFEGKLGKWVTSEDYVFSYIDKATRR